MYLEIYILSVLVFLRGGLLTSVIMVGKDLTENILLNGNQDYQHQPFTSKLVMMGKFLPVVLLTTIFRLGSLALAIHHIFILQTGSLIIALKLILMLPPALTIMYFSKLTNRIPELTVVLVIICALTKSQQKCRKIATKSPQNRREIATKSR